MHVAQLNGPGTANECTYDTVKRVLQNMSSSVLKVLGVLIGKSTSLQLLIPMLGMEAIQAIVDAIGVKKYLWRHATLQEKGFIVGFNLLLLITGGVILYEGSEYEEGIESTNKGATWAFTIGAGTVNWMVTQMLQSVYNTIQGRVQAPLPN